MNPFFPNRNYIRWSAVSAGSVLLILAAYNFYRYAKSPTDENIFQNPPSRISIIRYFPASSAGTDQGQTEIKNGDLLLGINGQKVNELSQIDDILSNAPADEPVSGIYRADLSGALRDLVYAGHQQGSRCDQADRGVDRGERLPARPARSRAAAAPLFLPHPFGMAQRMSSFGARRMSPLHRMTE